MSRVLFGAGAVWIDGNSEAAMPMTLQSWWTYPKERNLLRMMRRLGDWSFMSFISFTSFVSISFVLKVLDFEIALQNFSI